MTVWDKHPHDCTMIRSIISLSRCFTTSLLPFDHYIATKRILKKSMWYGLLGPISFPWLHTSSRYITGAYKSFPWNANVFRAQCHAVRYSKYENGNVSPKSLQGSKTWLAMVQPPGNHARKNHKPPKPVWVRCDCLTNPRWNCQILGEFGKEVWIGSMFRLLFVGSPCYVRGWHRRVTLLPYPKKVVEGASPY